ncbi:MAG: adenosine deaminase [Calditrichaeota bacterium]|nr:adenosine deaminase [Calditrichota bacterium]
MEIPYEILEKLPKTDLHVHLDGSLRIDTLIDLARKQNVELPSTDPKKLAKIVMSGKNCKNLAEYLRGFEITLSVLQEPEALYRVAYELAEDAAAENVWYMEVRYSPILHTKKGLKLTTIVDAVIEGLQAAEKKFNIKTGVIICGMRNINPETSLLLAELAVAYKNRGVVAFDLAGQEENYPAKHHKEAFFLIRKNNINTTAHAGEAFGPESIHQAIHYCGAHRIGHGTRLYEDGDLLNYVNDHRIPLEICLTSNVQTGAASSLETHPLRFYYDYGLRVCINTDNRLISDTTVTKELYLAAKHLDFTLEDIKSIIIDGFKSAFLPNRAKSIMLNMVNDELKKY